MTERKMTENRRCKRCDATLSPDDANAVFCADCWIELSSNADLLDSNPFAARNFAEEASEPLPFEGGIETEKIATGPFSAFLAAF